MSEIKINIRQSGNTPGTSKWLAEQVAGAEFRFGKTTDGEFAIIAKWPGAEKSKALAFIRNEDDEDRIMYFYKWDDKWSVQIVSPNDEDYNHHRPSVFKQQMTTGARKSYYNLIRDLIAEANNIIEADSDVRFDVSVTIKSTTNE